MLVCLALVVCAFVLVVVLAVKSSSFYRMGVARAKGDARVQAALGSNLHDGMFLSGDTHMNGSSREYEFRIPISGSKGKGTIYLVVAKSARQYQIDNLSVKTNDGEIIDLNETNPSSVSDAARDQSNPATAQAIGVVPAASPPEQNRPLKAYERWRFITEADVTKGDTLRLLLLHNINDRYVRDFLSALRESPRVRHDDETSYQFYDYPHSGLSLTVNDQGDIGAVGFSPDNQYGYRHYKGTLPYGLVWTDTRADVERKLGPADTNKENETMYYPRELYITYVSNDPHSLMWWVALDSNFRGYNPPKRASTPAPK